jgi:hypothetical protein
MTMAIKWPESVRNSGKLLIWSSAVATAGWPVALERAIKEFNRAAHARRLALRFELATKESDAQVTFGVGKPEEFQSSTHGTTSLSSIEHSGEIVQADIVVHPKPQVWAPRKKEGSKEYEQVQRDAGDGIRLVIIAHEFVHACGLEKHSNNESQEVFYSPLEPNSGFGLCRLGHRDNGSGFRPTPERRIFRRVTWLNSFRGDSRMRIKNLMD